MDMTIVSLVLVEASMRRTAPTMTGIKRVDLPTQDCVVFDAGHDGERPG
ncbi:MAG: hypothetical protein J0M09_16510 [Xanthomonadales bacterium]|nr:hypothetical protein [Xanthomonadales bacterium]